MEKSPWLCHICDYSSIESEARVCELCYRTTCDQHLQAASVYDRERGLYVTAKVCDACRLENP